MHPVIGELAKSLLGDDCQSLHGRLVRDYLEVGEVDDGGTNEHGSRLYKFPATRHDGYWLNHMSHHAVACGDISALVALMDRSRRRARERTGSPLACQGDVELVLASLLLCVDGPNLTVQRTPALLSKVYRALSVAYGDKACGDRAVNTEKAVLFCQRAQGLSTRATIPLDGAATQNSLGNAYGDLVSGDNTDIIEQAIVCSERSLEVRTREAAPLEWAATQDHLGSAYRNGVHGDKGANADAAVACYKRASEVRKRTGAALEWAATQIHLGSANTSATAEVTRPTLKRPLDAVRLRWRCGRGSWRLSSGQRHRSGSRVPRPRECSPGGRPCRSSDLSLAGIDGADAAGSSARVGGDAEHTGHHLLRQRERGQTIQRQNGA